MKYKCYLVLKKVARYQLAALNSNFLSTKDQMLVCKRDEAIRSKGKSSEAGLALTFPWVKTNFLLKFRFHFQRLDSICRKSGFSLKKNLLGKFIILENDRSEHTDTKEPENRQSDQ